jgi:putative phage-type endonuclease
MKIVELDQGTPEWLEWRSGGITATDISSICGVNQYVSAEELFLVKTGQQESSYKESSASSTGTRLEPHVRELVKKHYDADFRPVCVEHISKPYLRASLDGLDYDNRLILEIKCASHFGTHKKNRTYTEYFDKDWKIHYHMPEYYLFQLNFQMLVTGIDIASFASYFNSDLRILHVSSDKKLQKHMEIEAKKFWNRILKYNNGKKK